MFFFFRVQEVAKHSTWSLVLERKGKESKGLGFEILCIWGDGSSCAHCDMHSRVDVPYAEFEGLRALSFSPPFLL